MPDILKFPKGSIITFTTGEYSSFSICGYVVTVQDCDLPALAQQYRDTHKPKADDYYYTVRPEGFPSWLIANGHCMPVSTSEVHVGNYGDFTKELGGTE
jgi:hypothetical protein